jgi:hypothetical protein
MKHLILSLLFIISIFSASAFPQCTEGNCENGQGTYKYSNGDKYKGEWKNNRCDGQGTLTYLDGSNYVGQWKNHQRHGQGTYIYSDGSKYIGQFNNNQRHGQGTYIFPDGSKYVGQFKDGQMNGQGTLTYPDGSKYIGQLKNHQRQGQGTYIFPDGSKYVGQWKNNSYIKNPKGNETHKTLPKKMAEEKSQKAVSSKASEKTTIKRYHTVRNGETLYSISRRHNLTVQKIRRLNNLNSSVIHPGQKLLLTL